MGGEMMWRQEELERAKQEYRMRAMELLVGSGDYGLVDAMEESDRIVAYVMYGDKEYQPDVPTKPEPPFDPIIDLLPKKAQQGRPEAREEF